MVESHRKMFFGQNVAMNIQSSSWYDPFIFFTFIKKKPDNVWEKPSEGEGKVLKFSLEEMVMILQVLNRESKSWSTVHTYKGEKTSITFRWDDENKDWLWVHINKNYQKQLNFAQIEIFRMLLTHILQEKIEYSTSTQKREQNMEIGVETESSEPELADLVVEEEYIKTESEPQSEKEHSIVQGIIKSETQKALLIEFEKKGEIWIPKSAIHSDFKPSVEIKQELTIENWILKKNRIIN